MIVLKSHVQIPLRAQRAVIRLGHPHHGQGTTAAGGAAVEEEGLQGVARVGHAPHSGQRMIATAAWCWQMRHR